MSQIADAVLLVVRDFVQSNILFTALDVSNKVKESFPQARHRDVRDEVRALFNSEMDPNSYAATPITVTLADGSTQAQALLYHPLADSWDLDSKYDAQQRAQVSAKVAAAGSPLPVVSGNGTSATVSSDGTISVSKTPACNVLVVSPVVNPLPARSAWDSLFDSSTSLFPRKS